MTRTLLVVGAAVAALSFGQPARANDTYTFAFYGSGVSGAGTFTVAPNVSPPDPNPLCGQAGQNPCRSDPPGPGTLRITGITGTFSDAAIGISNASISGLVPIDPANERDAIFDPAVPTSLSFIDYANEGSPGGAFSYDNLFFPGGNPIDCNYPFSGTFLDVFGAAFTIAGGDTVVLWGDGNYNFGPLTYGVAVTDGINALDYRFSGLSALSPVPEPSTWAMLLLGFAGLGYAGVRQARKAGHLTAVA